MTKIASTVTQIIPEWIKNAAQMFKSEEDSVDDEFVVEEMGSEGTDGGTGYLNAEPLSSHSIPQTSTSKSTYLVPLQEEPSTSEPQIKRLSAIKITRSEPKEKLNPSRAPIVGTTTIEVDDEGSSSSENTASSTSGCSSLVPSHQDNLQRLHLPKSSLDRLRQELMKTSDRYTRSATKEDTSSRNSSSLWTSRSGNREFDASKFIASGSTIPFPVRSVTSPFYPGATKFGGASARRVEMLASSPYNLNQRKLAPVLRVRANESSSNFETEVKMSSAARKILESMDRISSPLEEAKKMPLRGKPCPSNQGPVFTTARLNTSQSLRPSTSGMSQVSYNNSIMIPPLTFAKQPNTAMSVPSRINWNSSSIDTVTMKSSLVKQDGGGGGKMKMAKSSGRIPLTRDSSNDVSNEVILPHIELPPPKNLPSFNFGSDKSREDGEEPLKKKKDDLIIIMKNSELKFSSPVVRSRDKQSINASSDTVEFSCPRKLEEKSFSPLIPSSSSDASSEPPKTELLAWGDKFKPAAGSWSCPVCMLSNAADCSRCPACEAVKP